MFTYIYQHTVCVIIYKTSCKQSIADFYLELYFAVSRKAIYKIKIKTLLECLNKEKANKNTELVITLSSQTGQITSAGLSVFYSDPRASIFGTNVFEKHRVRYPNAIILFNR